MAHTLIYDGIFDFHPQGLIMALSELLLHDYRKTQTAASVSL
jgi:hypothetical protein